MFTEYFAYQAALYADRDASETMRAFPELSFAVALRVSTMTCASLTTRW
jgi:hypothetical protein